MRYLFLLFVPFLLAADREPGFEMQDLSGESKHFNGTVGTTPISIPSSPDKVISEVLFKCPAKQTGTRNCFISFDAGTTFFDLEEGEYVAWSYKGRQKQIQVKGSAAGTAYQVLINFEED